MTSNTDRYLDPGALNDPPEPAIDKAAVLGTEHGTRDATSWVTAAQKPGNVHAKPHPQPDPDYMALSLLWDSGLLGSDDQTPGVSIMCTYDSAYRAAVETTIRERCES